MKNIVIEAQINDQHYYGLLQESANRWRKELAEIDKWLKDYENNNNTKVSRNDMRIMVERKNTINVYLSEIKHREPTIEARISTYNQLRYMYESIG